MKNNAPDVIGRCARGNPINSPGHYCDKCCTNRLQRTAATLFNRGKSVIIKILTQVTAFRFGDNKMSKDSRPKPYKSGRIRQDNEAQILRSAEQEFAEKGFEGASINSIAKRAGIPRSNVHYYFNSKLDLYVAVLNGVIELWNEAFSKIKPEDDPAEALATYIRSKVMYSRSYPLASKIFASEIMHGAPNLSNYFKEEFRPWVKKKAAVIQDWVDMGKMDPVDPYHLIFLIWSATQHYADFDLQVCAALGKSRLSKADFEKVSDTLMTIVLKGCGLKVPA